MVTRWDPFSEALSLRDAMGRLFEQAVLQPGPESGRMSESSTFAPALDVQETHEGYTVKASLPGVRPEDVTIQYQQGVLAISGTVQEEESREQGAYHLRERRRGRFSRTISLPDTVDADRAEATFENGVLTLRLPKAESMKPRRIPVRMGSAASPVEGGSPATNGNGHLAEAAASS